MGTERYAIRGGVEGRERLRMLARVMRPFTHNLFERIGIREGMACLDAGCGGGDVTFELARRVGPAGRVVGIDLDDVKLGMARDEAAVLGLANVSFLQTEIGACHFEPEFDVIYTRFLLTHLADPIGAIQRMQRWIKPGGLLIVEDIDFTGHFCEPSNDAFWRFVELYTAVVQARGCDPNIGPRLPGLLRGAGLSLLGMNVVQTAGFDGEAPLMAPITLEAIADAVLGAGLATADELNATVDDLYAFVKQDGTVVSGPRVVQAWGRRPT